MLRIAGIIPFPSYAIAKLQPDTMVNIPKITKMVYDGMSFNVNPILGLKAALPRTYLGGYFLEPSHLQHSEKNIQFMIYRGLRHGRTGHSSAVQNRWYTYYILYNNNDNIIIIIIILIIVML